jgi:hypothetical protein
MKISKLLAILSIAVISVVGLTGCLSLQLSPDNAKSIGKNIALTYYLTESQMDQKTGEAVKIAWIVFDSVIDQNPDNNDELRDFIRQELNRQDVPADLQFAVAELLFTTITEVSENLHEQLSGNQYIITLRMIHDGISETIVAHERYESSMPPRMKVE